MCSPSERSAGIWLLQLWFSDLSFNREGTRGLSLKACSGLAVLEGQEHGKQSQVEKKRD